MSEKKYALVKQDSSQANAPKMKHALKLPIYPFHTVNYKKNIW